MIYEIKSAREAFKREIFYDKNTNKLSYKNDLNIVFPLQELTIDQLQAINNSNSPSGSNPFATIADIGSGSASSPIVPDVPDFTDTPLIEGSPLVIPTTLREGSKIYGIVISAEDLDGVTIQIGFTNQPTFYSTAALGSIDVIHWSMSVASDEPNIDIVLESIGGDITTGTIRLFIYTI